MTEQHPITPPPKLVEKWHNASPLDRSLTVATQAARWGADTELEACCEWLTEGWDEIRADKLRAARRPNSPSLAEEAHDALGRFFSNAHTQASQMAQDFEILRHAVQRLQELENNG